MVDLISQLFLLIFVPNLVQGYNNFTDIGLFPEFLTAFKYSQEADGKCFIHEYLISYSFNNNEEPLTNHVPRASYPSQCFNGQSMSQMSVARVVPENLTLVYCAYFEERNHQVKCQYLDLEGNEGFVDYLTGYCNSSEAAGFERFDFSKIKSEGAVRIFNKASVCTLSSSEEVPVVTNLEEEIAHGFEPLAGVPGKKYQKDAKTSNFGGYSVDIYSNNSVAVYQRYKLIKDSFIDPDSAAENDYQKMLAFTVSKAYDYICDSTQAPIQFPKPDSTFLGFTYTQSWTWKMFSHAQIVVRNKMAEFSKTIDAPRFYYKAIAQAFSVQWNPIKQKTSLFFCVVSQVLYGRTPELNCYKYNGKEFEYDDTVFFDACASAVVAVKPGEKATLIIGDVQNPEATLKNIILVTKEHMCNITLDGDKSTDELLERPEQLFGYDPVRNIVIEYDPEKHSNNQVPDPEAHVYSFGQNIFVNEFGTTHAIDEKTKHVQEVGNYDYAVENLGFKDLNLSF